jgi:hypothetical protein
VVWVCCGRVREGRGKREEVKGEEIGTREVKKASTPGAVYRGLTCMAVLGFNLRTLRALRTLSYFIRLI